MKLIGNIIINGEILKSFPLKFSPRLRCPLLPLIFNILLQVLAREMRQEKEIKRIHFGKKDIKLFEDDITLCVENPQVYTHTQS